MWLTKLKIATAVLLAALPIRCDYEDTRMQIEDRISTAVCDELTRRGHVLEPIGSY